MGVVVRRYIDILIIIITFPYSTCISSFIGSSIPTSLFIFKMFFRSCLLFLCSIANIAQITFKIAQKSISREHGNIINYIYKNIESSLTGFRLGLVSTKALAAQCATICIGFTCKRASEDKTLSR